MKTILATLAVAALAALVAALAFVYSGIYDVSASSAHGRTSRWLFETTMHESVERRADQVKVPDLDDRSMVLAGVNDFEQMCVQCHGAPGADPAALGKGLNPPAPDLSKSATEMSAAELFWITKHGIKMTGMPAWGTTHEDDALWPVVAFMAKLPELDAAGYAELRESAKGMGHHVNDTAGTSDSHARQDPPHSHSEESNDAEEVSDAEHDHSGHEH